MLSREGGVMIKSRCVGVAKYHTSFTVGGAKNHMSCSVGGAKDHKLFCGWG